MKIALLGTRGIPNNYGGFEQFAEYISIGLVQKGHDVTVYSPHFHPYKEVLFKGVNIVHVYCPENILGAAAHFVYDWLCMRDALKRSFDIIFEAGYHSNAPSYYLLSKDSPPVITNMDGIEWKRSKWNAFTKYLIKKLEKIAVEKSTVLVSDNKGIQQYYKESFGKDSTFIAYGADIVPCFDESILKEYHLKVQEYFLLVARLEPENNIETILDGYVASESVFPFIVIGNTATKYGKMLLSKYNNTNIRFIGGLYSKEALDALRFFAYGYFHGHSVGGTNPSLLEAMASSAFIIAHKNPFNESVLGENAIYFSKSTDVALLINDFEKQTLYREAMINANKMEIEKFYSWSFIVEEHIRLFEQLINKPQ